MTIEKNFSEKELSLLDSRNIPHHVAIIMDGNRRWEKKNFFSQVNGHRKGADVLVHCTKAALELGIKVLTVFAFSTENWRRSPKEVEILMELFELYLTFQRETLLSNGVRLCSIGEIEKLPENVFKALKETEEITRSCDQLTLVLALNYGGRNEITRAVKRLLQDYEEKKFQKNDISEELFSSYLDTASWKDPDLLIRTSGEQRLSNFLLWQLSYAEWVFSDVLWPDFSEKHLYEAILEFQKRTRRKGGL